MVNTYVFEDYPVKLCQENYDDDKKQLHKSFLNKYPELENLSFGESIQISLNQIDTIPTLIPLWIGEDKSIQLKNWLEVRLNESEIRIIPSN